MERNRGRRLSRSRSGFAHVLAVVGLVIAAAVFLLLAFVPAGGLVGYNVRVAVTSQEISLIVATSFSVTGVSGTTLGATAIIPLNAWFQSIAPPALLGKYSETTCVTQQHCATLTGDQLLPSIPFVNGASASATNSFTITNVPAGNQPITVQLFQNSQLVATGSGSMCVNGGC